MVLVLVLISILGAIIILFILSLGVASNTISCLISISLITGIVEITIEHSFPDGLSIAILTVVPVEE